MRGRRGGHGRAVPFRAGSLPRFGTPVAAAAALLVSAVGVLQLTAFLAGWPSAIDELLGPQPGRFASVPAGRMSPLTASGFALAGAAVVSVLLGRARPSFADAGGFLASLVLLLSIVVTLGYCYGTPLLGHAELLLREMPPGDGRAKRVEHIQKAAAKAAELTRQLLAFGRKQLLQPRIVDLNPVLEDVEKMLRRLIGEDIQVVRVPGADRGRVRVDVAQMEQVIINLAVNARDAMPRGGTLIIETANVELDESYAGARGDVRPGPHVMLAVSDTGQGPDSAHRLRPSAGRLCRALQLP